MPTGELSDALNPYASQTRRGPSVNEYAYAQDDEPVSYQPIVHPPLQHVPHVSELELAVAEPPPPAAPFNRSVTGNVDQVWCT
jgi:hypothetical protein